MTKLHDDVLEMRKLIEHLRSALQPTYLDGFERGLDLALKKNEFSTRDAFANEFTSLTDRGERDGYAGDVAALLELSNNSELLA